MMLFLCFHAIMLIGGKETCCIQTGQSTLWQMLMQFCFSSVSFILLSMPCLGIFAAISALTLILITGLHVSFRWSYFNSIFLVVVLSMLHTKTTLFNQGVNF